MSRNTTVFLVAGKIAFANRFARELTGAEEEGREHQFHSYHSAAVSIERGRGKSRWRTRSPKNDSLSLRLTFARIYRMNQTGSKGEIKLKRTRSHSCLAGQRQRFCSQSIRGWSFHQFSDYLKDLDYRIHISSTLPSAIKLQRVRMKFAERDWTPKCDRPRVHARSPDLSNG